MDRHDVTDLDRLLSVLSHDLREPLRAIKGFGELLEREAEGDLSERGHEFLSHIRAAGLRMEALLDGVGEFDRAGRSTPQPTAVDLDEALEAVLRDRQEDIRARQAQVTGESLGVVTADPAAIRRVLDELVANALKFNERREPHVHVAASSNPDAWELTVSDDGIGVPERERDRVFEMFRRLHPRDVYPGNGVGLAVCKRIVEGHGGRIWIEGGPDGGSAVHVVI